MLKVLQEKYLRLELSVGRPNADVINYLLDEGANVNASSSFDSESILAHAIRYFYYWPDGPIDLAIIERMLKQGLH